MWQAHRFLSKDRKDLILYPLKKVLFTNEESIDTYQPNYPPDAPDAPNFDVGETYTVTRSMVGKHSDT